MTVASFARKWHRRLSVIVGVQLLLWTVSGLVFAILPIEEVRGNHLLNQGAKEGIILDVDKPTLPKLSLLTETEVRTAAISALKSPPTLLSIELINEAPNEYRGGPLPAWQATFADNVVLYLDPKSAAINAVRTDKWRLFDFLWMLHIMDYDERENFNHPLLIIAASFGVITSLSGLILTWIYYRKKAKYSS